MVTPMVRLASLLGSVSLRAGFAGGAAVLFLILAAGGAAAEPYRFDGRPRVTPEARGPSVKGKVDPALRHQRSHPPAFGNEVRIYPEVPGRLPEPIYQPLPATPPPPRPAPEMRMPAPVTSCDPNGCYDSSGARYSGQGPGMIRSDGKLCQQVGNMMHCN
jgi:hypothetical protein